MKIKKTEIWLIRHGETDWNSKKCLQGWRDIPLNDVGKQQAKSIRQWLETKKIPFDRVFSSDLQRAIQTAEIIFKGLGIPSTQEPQLRERNYGIYEGQPWGKLLQLPNQPEPEINIRDPNLVIPEGESLLFFHDRVINAFNRIAAKHSDENIAVVAHGGVIDMVWRQLQKLDLTTPHPRQILNASVNHFSIDQNKQWQKVAWDQIDHL